MDAFIDYKLLLNIMLQSIFYISNIKQCNKKVSTMCI